MKRQLAISFKQERVSPLQMDTNSSYQAFYGDTYIGEVIALKESPQAGLDLLVKLKTPGGTPTIGWREREREKTNWNFRKTQ